MNKTNEFDLIASPLEGKNLIEASAGTGKTYTITGLFLRLLLEKDLKVDEILVVTFTEAATNELTDRVRRMLRDAREAFLNKKSDDDFLNDYIKKVRQLRPSADRLLNEAIRDFDQAAIMTIHGFCNKVLQENAFESRSLFDTELVTEQTDLLRQIVEDFWRQQMYHRSGLFVSYACRKINPDALFKLLERNVGLAYLEIIPKVSPKDTRDEEAKFAESFRELQRLWPQAREEIAKIFLNYQGLQKRQYGKDKIPGWLNAMDAYIAHPTPEPVVFNGFVKFTTSGISQGKKGGYRIPEHAFFEACEVHFRNHEVLTTLYDQHLIALKLQLFDYARKELAKRKLEKNIQFFDDLLLNLHAALQNDGQELANEIRSKFRAALIDEFQDTDPIQYAIFRKIFDHEQSTLFLIGDPKQAIYRFRGADVFAYMQAKHDVEKQYTLSRNWRSEPGLISAINKIFNNVNNAFIYEEIPFQEASAPEKAPREFLKFTGESPSPFQLWFVDASKLAEKGKPVPVSEAREHITSAVASEIARLLNLGREGKAHLDGRALEERDIAVLVRKNTEARMMQEALAQVGIHAVLYSAASLFASEEAEELERILAALAEPRRIRLLKGALATQILGVSGDQLLGYRDDDAALEKWFDTFNDYHKQWQERGFIRMFKKLLHEQTLLTRLMSFQDGERRITNLLHLSEVLHHASSEQKLGMPGLVKWLSEQRAINTAWNEEHQLRLESDENAVRLVTMHMSKGLEFPVVFCPFTWSDSNLRPGDTLTFHDENRNRQFTLDLGSENLESNKMFAKREELAENVRLMYVAVTRAKNRCYLVWGRINRDETSAPAYIFAGQDFNESDIVAALGRKVKELGDDERRHAVEKIAAASRETIHIADLPLDQPHKYRKLFDSEMSLTCHTFQGKIDARERISSYSALVSRQPHGVELADYDVVETEKVVEAIPAVEPEEFSSVLTFPRGAKTGRFMHEIFQSLDFKASAEEVEQLIQTKLLKYGFEDAWLPAICKMVNNVTSASLGFENENLTLSEITKENRLNELEFYFPLKTLSVQNFRASFSKAAGIDIQTGIPDTIEQLTFLPFKGYMKGFIDLVFQHKDRFYIVDWKSNYLGSRVQEYHSAAVSRAMGENLYLLQYHIYTVALNQYLKLRIPDYSYEKRFGGIFYIFMRGVDPAVGAEFGIFRSRPSEEMVDELSDMLLDI